MITIKLVTGERKRLKADTGQVENGVFILYRYTQDPTKLQMTTSFPEKSVDWAMKDDGTVLHGDPHQRFMD